MRVWRYVLHVLIASYLIATMMWSLPPEIPLKRRIDKVATIPFRALGLWQNWQMFAPNPPRDDHYVSAKVTLVDGRVVERIHSAMWKMSLTERYAKERWRKLFNDYLRLDEYKSYWPSVGRWVVREVSREESTAVAKVELWRHWRPTKPGMLATLDNDNGWQAANFYTFPEIPKPTAQIATPNSQPQSKGEVVR